MKRSRAFTWWHLLITFSVLACSAAGLALFVQRDVGLPAEASAATPDKKESSSSKNYRAKGRDVYAAWYNVPTDSIARRRAGLNELTAAHNKLPLGTLLRVTHLQNGKSVIVRITDRGIHDRKVNLDLCREAAEKLDMIGEGFARVRIEIVPEEHGASPADSRTAAPRP